MSAWRHPDWTVNDCDQKVIFAVVQTHLTCSCGDGWGWIEGAHKTGNLSDRGGVNFAKRVFSSREHKIVSPKYFGRRNCATHNRALVCDLADQEKRTDYLICRSHNQPQIRRTHKRRLVSTPSPILDNEPIVRQIRRDGSLLRKASGHPRA